MQIMPVFAVPHKRKPVPCTADLEAVGLVICYVLAQVIHLPVAAGGFREADLSPRSSKPWPLTGL